MSNKRDIKDKNDNLDDKAKRMEEQVEQNEMRRTIRSLKQRELENLRHLDNEENISNIKQIRFMQNCQIVEKHLALSVLNQEKKNFMQNYNDKYRSKLAKEKILLKENNSFSPYVSAT